MDTASSPRTEKSVPCADRDACLPQPASVVEEAAALDASARGAGAAPGLLGRHDDCDLIQRARQAAAILEQATPCRRGVGGGLGQPLSVDAAGLGLAERDAYVPRGSPARL